MKEERMQNSKMLTQEKIFYNNKNGTKQKKEWQKLQKNFQAEKMTFVVIFPLSVTS